MKYKKTKKRYILKGGLPTSPPLMTTIPRAGIDFPRLGLRKIFLRKEIRRNEFRTPIIPKHIPFLVILGYTIYIQKSENRCYPEPYQYDAIDILKYYKQSKKYIIRF